MNGLSTIAVFIYLSLVIRNGNGDELITELKNDSGFFKWVAALFVLNKLSNIGGDFTRGLWTIFLIALGLSLLPKIFEAESQITNFSKVTDLQNSFK